MADASPSTDEALLDDLERAAFGYFLQAVNPANGLIADTSRENSPCSIAVVGFALSAYPIAVERGWMARADAVACTVAALRFFHDSDQSGTDDATGYKGFYFHFLDMQTGKRVWRSELSMIDTALLIVGVLTAAMYFTANTPEEIELRQMADALYRRIDWRWAQNSNPTISHGWKPMNVLVVDVGGSNVKILASGQNEARKFSSGPKMTAEQMVSGVKELAANWKYDVVSIGYPGPARNDRAVSEPPNLAPGWVRFDFQAAFGCPVKLINDAAMQALGSYRDGKLLFLGLGTGLGSAMVVDGMVMPMELAHLPYKKGTFEDYVGAAGLEKRGKKKWRKHVAKVVAQLVAALQPDDVVLGGGNVEKLEKLPPCYRAGDNANAFLGGYRMWEDSAGQKSGGRRHQPGGSRNRGVSQSIQKGK